MSDGRLDPVIVSLCIFMEDETAAMTVKSIEKKVSEFSVYISSLNSILTIIFSYPIVLTQINELKDRVNRVKAKFAAEYPDADDLFPDPDGLDLKKSDSAYIATNSCSVAQKVKRILGDKIGGTVWHQDCHHRIHNVWLKEMEKALTKKLNQLLKDD